MNPSSIILIAIFAIGFLFIALEHKFEINKSWIALFMGATMWMVVAYGETHDELHGPIKHSFAEIFELVFFLMGAMTIVEMLGHFRFFTWVEVNLMKFNISNRLLFWILGLIAFFASAILDNLTSTLVMIHIGRYLYIKKENFNIFVINTIIAANAGGAMSPVGDVTTIMLWLAGKFTAWQIVIYGIVPSLVAWIVPQAILTAQVQYEEREGQDHNKDLPTQWGLIIAGFATFGIAVLINILHLPPFFGIIFGMGIVAIVIDYRLKRGKLKKKAGDIVNLVKHIDMATIFFFVGILLAVDALKYAGILNLIADGIFGNNVLNDPNAIITGHTTLGLLSSLFDNVPLTAAVIKMLPEGIDFIYWILLAITAGTGGSILVIGSAAGVAAMGQVKSLTFNEYLRRGSIPALLGYLGAVGTWYLMYYL
ncbi:sodium:proton antiporter NhaD [Reichenbachiella versicolor]|uniref:sodium:proton antiporter NhaD n=1 Tax=Reichenbachiella versicolor TaxID=1821036 RepID=UPI000D6EA943|nr:sodium:proton antiporter NhaD [Reichenbachiella versicolor]